MQLSPLAACLRLAASVARRLSVASSSSRGLCTSAESPPPPGGRSAASARRLSFLGGDHNEVTLLGTVTDIKDRELQKDSGTEPYIILHVSTVFRFKDSASGQVRSLISRHQVSTFNVNLVRVARNINPGDRVFISGRMEYFFATGKVRVATIHPTRIVPMLPKQLPSLSDEATAAPSLAAGFDGDYGDDAAGDDAVAGDASLNDGRYSHDR